MTFSPYLQKLHVSSIKQVIGVGKNREDCDARVKNSD
jgi:hypothetical protein